MKISDSSDKLSAIFMERYMKMYIQIQGMAITVEKIKQVEPEWNRICNSIGARRLPVPPMRYFWGTPEPEEVFIRDPEPSSSIRGGILLISCETAEKILALGGLPC